MAKKNLFKSENIWLAIIPVVGGILTAIITTNNFSCKRDSEVRFESSILREKAGHTNDLVVYKNYNDLVPMFSEPLKANLTRELFNTVTDSIKSSIGNFIKPIDTMENMANGNKFYYVKNQHEQGQSLTSVSFDDQGNIISLFYHAYPK